jgi:hypothetical protein
MLSGRTNEMERTLLQVRPKCLIYNALGISDQLRIAYGLSRNNANYEPYSSNIFPRGTSGNRTLALETSLLIIPLIAKIFFLIRQAENGLGAVAVAVEPSIKVR